MKALNLLAALAVIGTLGSPAAAQMQNNMGSMGNAPMDKGAMHDRSMGNMGHDESGKRSMHDRMNSDHRMMGMHHQMHSKMAMCHGMSHHQMMHNRRCGMMMMHHHHHHGMMMKHHM